MADSVGELFAVLGARVNRVQWSEADARIVGVRSKLDALSAQSRRAAGSLGGIGDASERSAARAGAAFGGLTRVLGMFGIYLGGRAAYGALIKFNATAEETKNQIAGMIALSTKTSFESQLGTADKLMQNLARRAASLPGTTAEYVSMLGNIAQPVTKAGLGMQELEDLTVGAVVAAKALREDAAAAARDVGQALRGQAGADDPFIGKLLDTAGYEGQDGRARFNQKTAKERAQIVKSLLTSPQLADMAKAQGQTFGGMLATVQDAIQQFFGKIGKPLFEGLKSILAGVGTWLAENKASIDAVASAIGTGLAIAFKVVAAVVGVVLSNLDLLMPVLVGVAGAFLLAKAAAIGAAIAAGAAWLAAMWPVLLIGAAIVGLIAFFRKLAKEPEKVRAHFRRMVDGIVGAARAAGAAIAAPFVAAWDSIKAFGETLMEFFSETVPNAIRSAFVKLWDAIVAGAHSVVDKIRNLPVIKQALDLGFGGINNAVQAGAARVTPTLPPGASAPAGTSVSTGDVTITVNPAPGTSEAAIGLEVKKQFDANMAATLRQTMDAR